MPTNYNQLLKDLEIGSVYIKIFICFWDVLSCYIQSCFISPISSESFPYMSRYFRIRQFRFIYRIGSSAFNYKCHKISGSILSSFNATVSFGNSNYLHSLLYGQEL